ncbi:AMP-binding protein [Nocardioides sp. MJB4]|uniref:AMP-binding protein n=1 Tax=Nocardioides donggukensis TaxID=2774019 RepID=A0A927K5S1_9ACTN|nr:AMP-binding protein [Nocardioides donggukensis]
MVEFLAGFGARPALVGNGAPDGGLSYADLADRVADVADRLGTRRRLVHVEGAHHVDAIVTHLGALAAGSPVLLTGPGAGRVAATYDPDVRWTPEHGLIERRAEPAAELHPDLALLLSTSGTTGSPKLVRLSHRNLIANAAAIVDYLGITEADVAPTALPIHYCYGLSVLHSHLLAGATVLLTDGSVVDPGFWEEFRRHGGTSLAGVPYTFELLDRVGFPDLDLPSLRYLTQAGGRLAPDDVRRYAALGRERGWDLVVMYGQTEATARMAWLPPLLAETAPETIGIPIPGGRFTVEPLPERPLPGSDEPEVGELVFHGDSVMLGYAEGPADLALGRTVTELRTGDVGRQREDGLFEIVGRRSRFVKVFGLRVDLDHVERVLARRGVVAAATDGGDVLVLGVGTGAGAVDPAALLDLVRSELGLPPAAVRLVLLPELPRLPNGKTDHRALVALATRDGAEAAAEEAASTADPGEEVTALVGELLGRPDATPDHSFVQLGGDSLSYVEVSLRLEGLLGDLPADWPHRPLGSLADLPAGPGADGPLGMSGREPGRRPGGVSGGRVPGGLPGGLPGGPSARRGRRVETSVLLRALAIVAIVGSHANLFVLVGGAHVLLGVLGFNFGRFHAPLAGSERLRAVGRSAARIAVPSVLVIGAVALVTPGLGWRSALLLNGLLGSPTWTEPAWHYWFVEAALALLVAGAALLAVPPLGRLARRAPFWFPLGVAVLALTTRYGLVELRGGDEVHRAHVLLWLFALGWAASAATRHGHRLLLSALTVLSLVGFFGDPQRELLVMAGLLLLVWVPVVRLPDLLARLTGLLAAASLWTYLVHWQVYPWLEDTVPLAATLLSLAAGVLAWSLSRRLLLLSR